MRPSKPPIRTIMLSEGVFLISFILYFNLEYKFYKFHISKIFEELFVFIKLFNYVIIYFGIVEEMRQEKICNRVEGMPEMTLPIHKVVVQKIVIHKAAISKAIVRKGVVCKALATRKAQD